MKLINLLFEKEDKIYVQSKGDVPKGKKINSGPKGGIYYIGSINNKKQKNDISDKELNVKKTNNKINKKYFPKNSDDTINAFFFTFCYK